ncbi:type II secretion system F family protein [Enterovibrio calviensis]|uniref:type II secretion system F family protein n=1 Tax=Enterovibrio calviensis TaxID=91359 RepID=UPI000AA2C2C9|nr:type II secretion system F family protein [Enterovibrio calviensis]
MSENFRYRVIDTLGELQRGELMAKNSGEALRILDGQGLTVVALESAESRKSRTIFQRPLQKEAIIQSFYELTTLLESGVAVTEAVSAIEAGDRHPRLDQAFEKMNKALQQGDSFSAALADSGLPLPDFVRHLIEAGEMTGDLAGSMKRALQKMQYDDKTAKEFRNSLTYPLILIFAGVAAVIIMFTFVVPKFSGMLQGKNSDLPALAEFVLTTGVWFNSHLELIALATVLFVVGGAAALRNQNSRQYLLNGVSGMPVVGQWLYESDIAGWSYTLSALLSCRVELLTALHLSESSIRVPRRKRAVEALSRSVKEGKSLADALEQGNWMTKSGINLVRVGEKTGRVAEMLGALGAMYEENSRNRMKKLLTLIEPVAILTIGLIIGTIILGIILAITSVNEIAM